MEELTLELLLKQIQSDDAEARTHAWLFAGAIGAPAIKPLAKIVAGGPLEVGRAAKRAMWKIVRTVGAPDGGNEKKAVNTALVGLLGDDQPVAVRREVIWMLSEIGCARCAVQPLAKLLGHAELREDARCGLERIPGEEAVEALENGLKSASGDFSYALAHSLRVRGVKLSEEKYPCQKLVPTKHTTVQPVGR